MEVLTRRPGQESLGGRGGGSTRAWVGVGGVSPRGRHNELPGVGGEEAIIVAQVEPPRVPLSMIRHQPIGDVLTWLLQASRLLDQIEAAHPHKLPHIGGAAGGMEELAPEEVEP